MTESQFWLCLEYRLCTEFKGLPEKNLRRLWCDGLVPQEYFLDDPEPRIVGRPWIADGRSGQQQWEFTLFLPRPVQSHSEVNWASLYLAENVTRWLGIDTFSKRLEFEPSAAVPDLS